jgi:hypothetical protein
MRRYQLLSKLVARKHIRSGQKIDVCTLVNQGNRISVVADFRSTTDAKSGGRQQRRGFRWELSKGRVPGLDVSSTETRN